MTRPLEITDVLGEPDILDLNRFLMVFPSIPGGGNSRNLAIRCFSASIPGISNEAFEAMMGGHTMNYRGRKIYNNPISLSFYEDVNMNTLRTLRGWHERVVGSQSGNSLGYIDDYSATGYLYSFDTTGAAAALHKLFRAFPAELPEITHSSESSTAVQIQASFRFTYMEADTHEGL